MQEILTVSGAVIRHSASTPAAIHDIDLAVEALGGRVVQADFDSDRDTVLTIMDQAVVGTTLTDADGTVYELWPSGWAKGGERFDDTPPFETIASATMPGGWSWAKC